MPSGHRLKPGPLDPKFYLSKTFYVEESGTSDHDQQHHEPVGTVQGMGYLSGHNEHLTLSDAFLLPPNGDLCSAVKDIHHRVKGRGMLAEPLTRIKCEEGKTPYLFIQ